MQSVNDPARKSMIQGKLVAIRKEYSDLGGAWILEYHQEELGICLFFANYCADAIIKGHFDLVAHIAKITKILQEIIKEYELRDLLLQKIHTTVIENEECRQILSGIRDYLIAIDQLQLIETLRKAIAGSNVTNQIPALNRQTPTALNPVTLHELIKFFNEVYSKGYIQHFKLLDQHDTLKKFDAKHYSGVTTSFVENLPLTVQDNKLSDDQLYLLSALL